MVRLGGGNTKSRTDKRVQTNGTDTSKWLHHVFELAFLKPEDAGDSFAENLIPNMPNVKKKKVEDFVYYVLSIYNGSKALCPHSVWYEIPSNSRTTNNGPEAFLSHYNEQFYVSYPSMFVLLDILTKMQTTTFVT